jgi:hypothetical protein
MAANDDNTTTRRTFGAWALMAWRTATVPLTAGSRMSFVGSEKRRIKGDAVWMIYVKGGSETTAWLSY